ncbi:MAG: Cna B-type [Phycisphaerales bacterium]|nr:Cna B-type [Phycisphaerales bacterium]
MQCKKRRVRGKKPGSPIEVLEPRRYLAGQMIAATTPESTPVAFGNAIYYPAYDASHNGAIYRSDGTTDGTVVWRRPPAPASLASGRSLTPVGAKLFFIDLAQEPGADAGVLSPELYVSDGTAAGTRVLTNLLNPVENGGFDALHAVNGKLVFLCNNTADGNEMYESDGTVAGTHRVREAVPGSEGMWGGQWIGNLLYFATRENDGASWSIWTSDGTDAGTKVVATLSDSGSPVGFPTNYCPVGNRLLFQAQDWTGASVVWAVDAGQQAAHRLLPGVTLFAPATPVLYSTGNKAYFIAEPADQQRQTGGGLYVTDGTTAGTHRITIAQPGLEWDLDAAPNFTQFGSNLLFASRAGLWVTDGTDAGTKKLFDGEIVGLTQAGAKVYFRGSAGGFNNELCVSDGTPQGTRLLEVLNPGDSNGSWPCSFMQWGSDVYFAVINGPEQGLYRVPATDGPVTSIAGTIYVDANANGQADPGERGVTGRAVFDDVNGNGVRDPGEPSAVTDATGAYAIELPPVLPGGLATAPELRQILPSGSVQTWPSDGGGWDAQLAAGQQLIRRDFGSQGGAGELASISGLIFRDTDRSGTRSPTELPLSGQTVYLDLNNNAKLDLGEPWALTNLIGRYTLAALPAGTYTVRQVVAAGLVATFPKNSAGQVVSVVTNQAVAGRDFGAGPAPTTGSLSGTVFKDVNANGIKDTGEPPLAGWTVWLDTDNDGVLDTTEASVRTDTSGNYKFFNLLPKTYTIRQVIQPTWKQTLPLTNAAITANVVGGVDTSNRNFGDTPIVLPPPPPPPPSGGSIAGLLFNDANANGIRDIGETPLGGWTVFLDADKDGILDTGELRVITPSTGVYAFNKLPAGAYRIREIFPAGWRSTTSSGFLDATITSNQALGSKNFGNTQRVAISGSLFNDLNRNLRRDTGELGLAGWKIFLDTDGDGVLDTNERSFLTDAAGNWAFKDLAAGAYRVRVLKPAGWNLTTPAGGLFTLTLGSGQSAGSKLFGAAKIS